MADNLFKKRIQAQEAGLIPQLSVSRKGNEIVAMFFDIRNRSKLHENPDHVNMMPVYNKLLQSFAGHGYMATGPGGALEIEGKRMFGYVSSRKPGGTYGRMTTHAQKAIETIQSVYSEIKANRPFQVVGLDIETMGDIDFKNMSGNPFAVTEIGIKQYSDIRLRQGKTGGAGFKAGSFTSGASRSYLFAPTNLEKEIKAKVALFMADPKKYFSKNLGSGRTLVDLMRYSTIGEVGDVAQFGTTKGSVLRHHNVVDKLIKGKTIDRDELIRNRHVYEAHMKSGLENLMKHGLSGKSEIESAIKDINALMKTGGANDFLMTYNGMNFDVPVLSEWIKQNTSGLRLESPKKHLDLLQAINTVIDDPKALHGLRRSAMALGMDDRFEEGLRTLQELSRSAAEETGMGAARKSAHMGLSDVDDMLRVFVHYFGEIGETVEKGKGVNAPHLNNRVQDFGFGDAPIRKGQRLYSHNGLRNYTEDMMDFQYELVDDAAGNKVAVAVTGDYNKQVLNARSFYRVLGIRKIEDGSPSIRYVLELLDEETGRIAAFHRESQEAIYELAAVLHDNTMDASGITKEEQREIRKKNKMDRARRYYENLFTMDQAGTKGFKAAKRMYKNAEVLKERLAGKYSEIKKRAAEIVDKEVQAKIAAGTPMTAEEIDDALHAKRGELMAERITHEEMMSKMKFMSLWDDENKRYLYNKQEERNFFVLASRLMSEEEMYNEAIKKIETALPGDKQGDARSRALMQFHMQMQKQTGGDMTTRPVGPHESQIIRVNEMTKGENYLLSLNDDNGEKSIRRRIYRDLSDRDQQDRERIAKSRLKLVISDLAHSGHLSKEQEGLLHEMFSEHYQNMQTSDMVGEVVREARKSPHRVQELQHVDLKPIQSLPEQGKMMDELDNILARVKKSMYETEYDRTTPGNVTYKISSDLDEFITALDQKHTLLGQEYLNPNHREHLDKLIQRLFQLNEKEGQEFSFYDEASGKKVEGIRKNKYSFTMSMNQQGSELVFNVFREEDSRAVIEALDKGSDTHVSALKIAVPLITREGTMSFGNRKMNASSFYQQTGPGKLNKISSFDFMMQKLMGEDGLEKILNQFEGATYYKKTDTQRIGRLNERVETMVSDIFDDLSSSSNRAGMNDSMYVRGEQRNLSDFFKQQQVDLNQAMIHDFYYKYPISEHFGLSLTTGDFKETAFVKHGESFVTDKQGRRILRSNVNMSDLQQDAQQRMLINQQAWFDAAVKGKGLVPDEGLYFSSVKSTDAMKGKYGVFHLSKFYNFGEYSAYLKDNQVQALNRYQLSDAQLQDLDKLEGVSSSPMMTNDMKEELKAKGFRMDEVQVKTAMMNQSVINERISQMMQSKKGVDLLAREGILRQVSASAVQKMDNAGILKKEMSSGQIIKMDGQYYQMDTARKPRVYENQAVFSNAFNDRMKAIDYKEIERPDDFEWNKEIYDEKTNTFKNDGEVKRGQVLGHKIIGGRREAVRYESTQNGRIESGVNDKTIRIGFEEKAFKRMIGFEKGTVQGSIEEGFSKEFMKALTGLDDVHIIMSSRSQRGADMFNSMVLESKVNLIHQAVYDPSAQALNKSGLTKDEWIKKWEQTINDRNASGDLLFKAVTKPGEKPVFHYTGVSSKLKDNGQQMAQNIQDLMNEMGVKDVVENTDGPFKFKGIGGNQTEVGIMSVSNNRVAGYNKVVDEQGRTVYGYEDGQAITGKQDGAKIGPRETDIFRYKGMEQTRAYYMNQMVQTLKDSGDLTPILGIMDSAKFYRYGETAVSKDVKSIHINQLENLPNNEYRKFLMRGTGMDEEFLRKNLGLSESHHGYFLELGKDFEGKDVTVNIHGRDANKLFIGFVQPGGEGQHVWKNDLYNANMDILKRAAKVRDAKDSGELADAKEKLRGAVSAHYTKTLSSLVSSKDFIGDRIKVQQKSSGRAILKVMDYEQASKFDHEAMILSVEDARATGAMDQLLGPVSDDEWKHFEKHREFMDADLNDKLNNHQLQGKTHMLANRNPSFGPHAIGAVRVYIDKKVQKGTKLMTTAMALYIRGDSDGDATNFFYTKDAKVQAELEAAAKTQTVRHEAAYQRVMEGHINAVAKELQDNMDEEEKRTISLEEIKKNVKDYMINTPDEGVSKAGKSLVGSASDMNYMMQKMAVFAQEQGVITAEEMDSIYKLGDVMEQKLTISSKKLNVAPGTPAAASYEVTPVNGASKILDAVQRFDLDEAQRIATQYGISSLSEEKNVLGAARQPIEKLLNYLKKIKPESVGAKPSIYGVSSYFPEFQIGTGSGVNLDRANTESLIDLVFGLSGENGRPYNEFVDHIRYLEREGQDAIDRDVLAMGEEIKEPEEPRETGRPYEPRPRTRTRAEERAATEIASEIAEAASAPDPSVPSRVDPLTYTATQTRAAGGGAYGPGPEMKGISRVGEMIQNNPKALMFAGIAALAVGGIAAMASSDNRQVQRTPAVAPPQNMYSPQGVYGDIAGMNFQVSASSSKGFSRDEISSLLKSSVQESGYPGKANVHVTHTDNSKSLSRQFYRDKVAEYI